MRRVPAKYVGFKQNLLHWASADLSQKCDRNHAGRAHFTPITVPSPRKL